MGGQSAPSRAIAQSAGTGLRLKASLMMDGFNLGGPVLHLFLRYTQALITQMAQTAVCNRHHMPDQQLCRWLLLSLDRLRSTELVMTQALIANMLGVRREGVTEAAGRVDKAGIISYRCELRCSTEIDWNSAPANAIPLSKQSTTADSPRPWRLEHPSIETTGPLLQDIQTHPAGGLRSGAFERTDFADPPKLQRAWTPVPGLALFWSSIHRRGLFSGFFGIRSGLLIVPGIRLGNGMTILNVVGLTQLRFGGLQHRFDRLFGDSVRNAPFDHRDL